MFFLLYSAPITLNTPVLPDRRKRPKFASHHGQLSEANATDNFSSVASFCGDFIQSAGPCTEKSTEKELKRLSGSGWLHTKRTTAADMTKPVTVRKPRDLARRAVKGKNTAKTADLVDSPSAIIIVDNKDNEIITLDETQSSSTEFEDICGNKKKTEMWLKSKPPKELGPYLPDEKTIATKVSPSKNEGNECPDCERVSRAISKKQFEFLLLA